MTALVFPLQATADAFAASVDALNPLGVDLGPGIHAPSAQTHTARSTVSTKHATLNLWKYEEDPLVQVATRTLAVPATGWGQDIVADANWSNASSHSVPVGLTADTFKTRGHISFIIPQSAVPGKWVFYAPTLAGLPDDNELWLIQQLNAAGIAVAGIDVGDTYGFPWGRELMASFYAAMRVRGFNARPVAYCRSRGGLQAYNWATENPACLAAIAGIYPVGDIASYPTVATAAPFYGMTTAGLTSVLTQHNPIDRLAPLAAAGIPIMHLHGDSDVVVPCSANSQVVRDRYTNLGGSMTLTIVAGAGHDLDTRFFQSQALANFIIARAV